MELHQIAFTNRGKVKKAEAAKLILELAEEFPAAIPKLGLLLALHQPPAPKAATLFAWVAQACAGPKELRKYLQYVMCDGDHIVGTDGSACHVAPAEGRAAGLYDPKTGVSVWGLESEYPAGETPSGHPGRFPDWQRIMPPPVWGRALIDLAPLSRRRHQVGTVRIVEIGGSSWVPSGLLEAAELRCNRVRLAQRPHVDSVYFEGPNGERAVIMPMREQWLRQQGVI